MKPEAGHTVPDEIPPVHVLEAAHKQDRRETEDLLAGFDRPGRGPKKPSPERDFVDYYAKKKGGPDSGRPSNASPGAGPPRQIDVSTVVKPRKDKARGMPAWLGWAGAAVLMLGIGGLVAYLATGETRPTAGTTMGPGPATTITGASTPSPSSQDIVPLPAPAEPATTMTTAITVTEPVATATDAPPRPTGRHDPRGAPSAGGVASAQTGNGSTTASSAQRKPPPRDDFIRDL